MPLDGFEADVCWTVCVFIYMLYITNNNIFTKYHTHNGIYTPMQSMQCDAMQCNAINAMQPMQCNAINSMQCSQCNTINAMQSM